MYLLEDWLAAYKLSNIATPFWIRLAVINFLASKYGNSSLLCFTGNYMLGNSGMQEVICIEKLS